MQVDNELKRKRESQINKEGSSIIEVSNRIDSITDLDSFSNNKNSSNKSKRQKLL